VLARGDCGSFLVTAAGRALVVRPFGPGPSTVHHVLRVHDLRPGDLVGRWDRLADRGTTVGYVPADAVRFDPASGHLDVDRLDAGLAAWARGPRPLVGAS
jgi:hypothetical protein